MQRKEKLRKKLESEMLKHSKDEDIESRRGKYSPAPETNLKINKDTIKIITAYDRKNERYIICEKSYNLQKYYVICFDEERLERRLENLVEITSYVVV